MHDLWKLQGSKSRPDQTRRNMGIIIKEILYLHVEKLFITQTCPVAALFMYFEHILLHIYTAVYCIRLGKSLETQTALSRLGYSCTYNGSPICLHTVLAAAVLNSSSHTVPQSPFRFNSIRPLLASLPPTNRNFTESINRE